MSAKVSCAAAVRRLAVALALVLALSSSTAFAYTVIMRSGRRVEIPATFIVTGSILTYEAAPGINVTLQLTNIDIAATEHVNDEPAGSLLRRANERNEPELTTRQANTTPPPARRTLTNRDLDESRRIRKESEKAYERRRSELGLPSLEESQRRAEEEARQIREIERRTKTERSQAEAYWRARAAELRTQMSVLNAEISYLRTRLQEMPDTFSSNTFVSITGFTPFLTFSPVFPARPRFFNANSIGVSTGAQLIGRLGVGGVTRGGIMFEPGSRIESFPRRVISPPRAFAPSIITFIAPFNYLPYNYFTSDRFVLTERLRALEAERAGLEARWRLLEDEARRAGALPGWLRP